LRDERPLLVTRNGAARQERTGRQFRVKEVPESLFDPRTQGPTALAGRVALHTPTPRILARRCGNARPSGNLDGGREPEHPKSRAGIVDAHRRKPRPAAGNMRGREGAHGLAWRVVRPRGVRTYRITASYRNVAGKRKGLEHRLAGGDAATHGAGTDRRDMAPRTDVGKLVSRSIAERNALPDRVQAGRR
jgi:hypothetical protein